MANPVLSDFNPKDVKWQYEVKKFIRKEFDYKTHGLLELGLSGSVGSAKSIFAANMGVSHCLMYSDATLGLFRLSMPDLKETIYSTILEHIEGSEIKINGKIDTMREGVHYTTNTTKASVDFINGAKIRSKSWSDKKYNKLRSHVYSAGIWEEVTENSNEICESVHPELFSRVGRVNHINSNVMENWLLYLTNPDSPAHFFYRYFISHEL
jgi:hypothetical protein